MGNQEVSMNEAKAPDPVSRLPPRPTAVPMVFVVDDDVSVRESVELLIRNEGWRPMLFESARDFLARAPTAAPSCLILDVNLPDLSGLDLQQRITGESAAMPIIFITGYGDIPTSVQAMKAGAAEFLTKPFDADILIEAIRGALLRSRKTLEERLERSQLQTRFETLSKRERQVMTLVVRGLMNKQVGSTLHISETTVKAHRGRVMEKMQATTFVDLVDMAAELGIRTST
jgi:FixJ family two-component response regulator